MRAASSGLAPISRQAAPRAAAVIEGLTARLLLDEDVDPALAAVLRQRDYDAVQVNEKGRSGRTDRDQLAFAAAAGRVLVTHNRNDFLALAADWMGAGAPHAGIVYARQAPTGELLRRLLALLNTLTVEDLANVVVPLEAFG